MVKKITKLESIGIIDKLVCRTSIPWTKPKYLAIGKELLEYASYFLEKKRIEKIILLVKKENTVAKKLYKLIGFKFTKMHNKKIENSIIEVWEKTLTYFN